MTKHIRLNQVDDVREFVGVAEECNFDIDIFYNRIIVDAKSILGVLALDLSHILTVKYYGSDVQLEKLLNKYAA